MNFVLLLAVLSLFAGTASALPEGCISTHSERCSGSDEDAAAYDDSYHVNSNGGVASSSSDAASPSLYSGSSSSYSGPTGGDGSTYSSGSSSIGQANQEHYNSTVYGRPY
jgi:hypothetical protein